MARARVGMRENLAGPRRVGNARELEARINSIATVKYRRKENA